MSITLPLPLDAAQLALHRPAFGELAAYTDRTVTTAAPLVLIHSVNAAASAFEIRPIFNHYRSTRPVYALDLPGFGRSSRTQRAYTPQLYSSSIIEFLRETVGTAADVVALSLSSEFAARASLAAPELFRSLVLISPSGIGRKGTDRLADAPPAAADIAHTLFGNQFVSPLLFKPLVSRRSIRFFLGKSFYKQPPDDIIEYAIATGNQPNARYAPLHFVSGRLFTYNAHTALYAKLSTPTLILYDQDPNVSFSALPELLDENRVIQAKRIANTRGLPHWDEPAATFAALDAFFGNLS